MQKVLFSMIPLYEISRMSPTLLCSWAEAKRKRLDNQFTWTPFQRTLTLFGLYKSVRSTKVDSFRELKSRQTGLCENLPLWCPGLISLLEKPSCNKHSWKGLFPKCIATVRGWISFHFYLESHHNFPFKFLFFFFKVNRHHLIEEPWASVCRSGAGLTHGEGQIQSKVALQMASLSHSYATLLP